MQIQGDYNSAVVRNFVIQFEKCDQAARLKKGIMRPCKSDKEILKWLRQKYILTYTNQRRFVIEEYQNERKIVEESRTKWIPINSQLREDIVFKLQMTDLNLQDLRLDFGGSWGEQRRVFKLEQVDKRPYEFENSIHISLTFEVDLDLKQIDRQVYNMLDWIGDIGGLGEGLFFISYAILGVVHFGALDNWIISELFRVVKSDKKEEVMVATDRVSIRSKKLLPDSTERDQPEEPMDVDRIPSEDRLAKTSSIREFLQYVLPKSLLCWCLKLNK